MFLDKAFESRVYLLFRGCGLTATSRALFPRETGQEENAQDQHKGSDERDGYADSARLRVRLGSWTGKAEDEEEADNAATSRRNCAVDGDILPAA